MECMICTEDLLSGSVGELDCCEHSFCAKCILKWAEKDSRCPACRGRFRCVTEKVLARVQPALGCTNDEEMKHSKHMLGEVVKVHDIPERNQRPDVDDPDFYFSDAEDDPMNEVFCVECGGGEDERNLLLCDGCDCACHTYCANLESIPEEEWYCHGCTEERERTNQGRLSAIIGNPQPGAAAAVTPAPSRAARRLTRAGAGLEGGRRRSVPGETIDLITPEERQASLDRPRRRLRRIHRQGPLAGVQGVEVGTTSDFLAALEARANSRTAGDAPSHAHRRLENLRQRWDRIRRGQAGFSGPVDLTTPDSANASGQSSSTQVSPNGGQVASASGQILGSGQPDRRSNAGHASETDAAFAALDDAIDYLRQPSARAAAEGAPFQGRGARLNTDVSSLAIKRKREDTALSQEEARPAKREQARPLRRPQPRERSGLPRSYSRPGSSDAPNQARASAMGHAAAPPSSPPPRSLFTAGSKQLQGGDSGRLHPSASRQDSLEHSSGRLHRVNSSSRQGSGGSQLSAHPASSAQMESRHAEAALSSVPWRKRAGAAPRDNRPAWQPSSHPQPQPHFGGYHSSATPGAGCKLHGQARSEPGQVSWMQHQSEQHSGRPWPGHMPPPVMQHLPPPNGQQILGSSGTDGGSLSQHGPNVLAQACPMHADQQPDLAASRGSSAALSLSCRMQQQHHQEPAEGLPLPRLQHPETHLPLQPPAPVSEAQDALAAVQQWDAWYGGLSSNTQAMQYQNLIQGESAPTPPPNKRGGTQQSQGSQPQAAHVLSPPTSHHAQRGHVPAAAARLSKKEAAIVVKPLLHPLLAQELLVEHQFSKACKRAVHLLHEGGAHSARAAVKKALSSMGLELAASRVEAEIPRGV